MAQNETNLLQILDDPDFNPGETVVLERDIDMAIGPASPNKVNISKYRPLEIKIDVYTQNPGILVLGDSFYPGWRAEVNGRQEKIFRAYSIFRAIPLQEGIHRVTFSYFPLSFLLGCAISILTLFVIVLEVIRRLIKG